MAHGGVRKLMQGADEKMRQIGQLQWAIALRDCRYNFVRFLYDSVINFRAFGRRFQEIE